MRTIFTTLALLFTLITLRSQELTFDVGFSEDLPTNVADWSAKNDNIFFTITNNTQTSFKAKALVWLKKDGEVKFLSDLNLLPSLEVSSGTNLFLADMIVPSKSLVVDELIEGKAELFAELFIYDENSKLTNYQKSYNLTQIGDIVRATEKEGHNDLNKMNINVASLHNKINNGIVINEEKDDNKESSSESSKIQIDVALLEQEFKKKNMVFINVSEGAEIKDDENSNNTEYAKISKKDLEGMYANNSAASLNSKESVVSYLTLQQAIQKVMNIKKSMSETESNISSDYTLTIN